MCCNIRSMKHVIQRAFKFAVNLPCEFSFGGNLECHDSAGCHHDQRDAHCAVPTLGRRAATGVGGTAYPPSSFLGAKDGWEVHSVGLGLLRYLVHASLLFGGHLYVLTVLCR